MVTIYAIRLKIVNTNYTSKMSIVIVGNYYGILLLKIFCFTIRINKVI